MATKRAVKSIKLPPSPRGIEGMRRMMEAQRAESMSILERARKELARKYQRGPDDIVAIALLALIDKEHARVAKMDEGLQELG